MTEKVDALSSKAQRSAKTQSMTGSGTAAGPTAAGDVVVECRSVNGKGLNVKTRLASECQGLEASTEAYIRTRLTRGTVYVTVAVTEPAETQQRRIDSDLALRVAEELRDLGKSVPASLGFRPEFEIRDLLAFPGVIVTNSHSGPRVSRELPDDLRDLLARAVDQLIASREQEGAATAAAIEAEIGNIEAALVTVRSHAPTVIDAYREKLLTRVNEFLDGRAAALEPSEVIREVSVFADRVDIAEEMQRLDGHLAKAREFLAGGRTVGRNLEFLVQEMLREVNTMGSKSPDVTIAHLVVDMKSAIDKLKEQAANLS